MHRGTCMIWIYFRSSYICLWLHVCSCYATIYAVVISATKEGVKFSTKGDIGSANIVCRQNTSVDKVLVLNDMGYFDSLFLVFFWTFVCFFGYVCIILLVNLINWEYVSLPLFLFDFSLRMQRLLKFSSRLLSPLHFATWIPSQRQHLSRTRWLLACQVNFPLWWSTRLLKWVI